MSSLIGVAVPVGPVTEADREELVYAAEHQLPPQAAAFILPVLQSVTLDTLTMWRNIIPAIVDAINRRDREGFCTYIVSAIVAALGLDGETARTYALVAWALLEQEGFALPLPLLSLPEQGA